MDEHYKSDEVLARLSGFLFSKNINDNQLKNYILRIHKVSESFADPDGWLEAAREDDIDNILEEKWVVDYINYMQQTAEIYHGLYTEILDGLKGLSSEDKKGQKFFDDLRDLFATDIAILKSFIEAASLDEKLAVLPTRWKSIPNRKKAELYMDLDEYDRVVDVRSAGRKALSIRITGEDIKREAISQVEYNNCLIDIVKEFKAELMSEKKRLKKYNFSDVAHAAYNILYDVSRGCPTKVGIAKSREYKYIYIDEYQDSSDIQENLLNAVAHLGAN